MTVAFRIKFIKMQETLTFLSELAANNNRDWFNANKSRYLKTRADVETLTARLIAGLAEIEPDASILEPSDCLYRIYRDTRFSSDKTPYKRHIGIYINPFGGKKSALAGYYLHLEPDNVFVGGGLWCPDAKLLKAVRQSIYDNVDEYLEIIENPEFKKHFPLIGEDLLKTAPKGFPKDWEHIELLRPRSYTACGPVRAKSNSAKDIEKATLCAFEVLKPYNDFLNYLFEENPSLPRFF